MHSAAKPQGGEKPPSLSGRPRALLEPDDPGFPAAERGPGGGGHREPAAEVEDSPRGLPLGSQGRQDLPDQQEMKRAVKTGKGGALCRSLESRAPTEPTALLDVDARERDDALPDLGNRQSPSVSLLDFRDPVEGSHAEIVGLRSPNESSILLGAR